MKTTIKYLEVALDIIDINEAISDFLIKKNYTFSGQISKENIEDFMETDQLRVNVEEFIAPSKTGGDQQNGRIYFSKALRKRVGTSITGLGVLLHNISLEQLFKYENKAYFEISDIDQKILSFTYSMTSKKFDLEKVKTRSEIKEHFDLSDTAQKSINAAIKKYASILYKLLLNALENDELVPWKEYKKEDLLKVSIINLGFSVRTLNCYKAVDAETISDLINMDTNKLRNFGNVSIREVQAFRKVYGI